MINLVCRVYRFLYPGLVFTFYHAGGSSRNYCCAFLIIPSHDAHKTKRIVQAVYDKWKINASKELKGSELTNNMRYFIGEKVVKLISENNEIKIKVVTFKKNQIPEIVQESPFDLIRNHILFLGVGHSLSKATQAIFYPDKKPTSKLRKNSAKEYLETRLWFDQRLNIPITYSPKDSGENQNLIFIDWISNTCWRFFENDILEGFDSLKGCVEFVHFNL